MVEDAIAAQNHRPEDDQKLAAGNFSIVLTLPNQAQLTMSGYLFAGESAAEWSRRLDIYYDVGQRQLLRAGLDGTKARRKALLDNMENHRVALAGLQKLQEEGQTKLTTVQKDSLRNAQSVFDEGARQIAKIDADLADIEARLKT